MLKLSCSPQDIARAAEILKAGGLAAFPTETVYGLGADAFNVHALAKVFEAKGRPRFDPLIIHIAGMDGLARIACLEALETQGRLLLDKLASAFWPGPLTLILPKREDVPGLATAGLNTAAVRFPAHPAAQTLIRLAETVSGGAAIPGAVAAPSANPFGRLSPTRAEHVIETLGDKIDCIIDGGPSAVGVESTVLDISGFASPSLTEPYLQRTQRCLPQTQLRLPRILRSGGISREQLEAVIGPLSSALPPDSMPNVSGTSESGPGAAAQSAVPSPGMLKSHYAPEIPLSLHSPEEMAALPYSAAEGYLFFSGSDRDAWRRYAGPEGEQGPNIFVLSEQGSIAEAAANLFDVLHRLDRAGISGGLKRIHAEALPEEGLGAAVNDRLRRAAVKP